MFKVGDAVRLRRPEEILTFRRYPEAIKKQIQGNQDKIFTIEQVVGTVIGQQKTNGYVLSNDFAPESFCTNMFLESELEKVKICTKTDEEFISIMF